MNYMGPSFLGIGAQKAGTTWLHYQLGKHPQIWLPPQKEIHFFDRSTSYPSPNDLATSSLISRMIGTQSWERPRVLTGIKEVARNLYYRRFNDAYWWSKFFFSSYNIDWYKSLFPSSAEHKLSGEITPSYSILSSKDVGQIKEMNPNMKHIFMLRNPIDRAWSAVRHESKHGRVKSLSSGEEPIVYLQTQGAMLRGDYERTLETYLEYFDAHQILICFYDAIQKDPINLLNTISDFLEIQKFDFKVSDTRKYINRSASFPIPDNVKDFLHMVYTPLIDRLAEKFGGYALSWKTAIESSDLESNNRCKGERLLPAFPLSFINKK
jgi:hypothetical protein